MISKSLPTYRDIRFFHELLKRMWSDDSGVVPLPEWAELYWIVHERVPTAAEIIAREGWL